MMEPAESYINQTRTKYLFLRYTEVILSGFAAGVLAYSIGSLTGMDSAMKWLISTAVWTVVVLVRSYQLRLLSLEDMALARYLSKQYKIMEDSTDLILREDSDLSPLQQLQKARAIQNLETIKTSIRLPHHIGTAMVVFLSSVAVCLLMGFWNIQLNFQNVKPLASDKRSGEPVKDGPAVVKAVSISIQPPAYTGIPASIQNDFNLKAPEGSRVMWAIGFTKKVNTVILAISGRDSIKLTESNNGFTTRQAFTDKGFYQLSWTDESGISKSSDFYRIEIIKDQPPKASIENLAQFTELTYGQEPSINVNVTLADDYGLKDAWITATVSKGSGESVKFREEKLLFNSPQSITGKKLNAQRSIDFQKLKMEPGDELYFYVEAIDNKPVPNHTRTETWFISLKDTTTNTIAFEAGMGVDLMPEYFRSQRQIIIDTEKLLAEKSQGKVTTDDFNYRSNELGYDQKVLRIRYGQFLGEEFETSIVPEEAPEEKTEEETEESLKTKFGHVHDKGNEHNLVKDQAVKKDQHHDENQGDPENPLEAFAHKHDKGDEATFFVQSIRIKLKAALTLMWEAELQLRLYQPSASLPYQYQILKLLKEISNDSRVYVHRTGFDPPPLKEEKRLSGELAEINNATVFYETSNTGKFPAIKRALKLIEGLVQENAETLNPEEKAVLKMAGTELAGVAMEQPGDYLQSLSILNTVVNGEEKNDQLNKDLLLLRKSFWNLLPEEIASPTRTNRSHHKMDRDFIEFMDTRHE